MENSIFDNWIKENEDMIREVEKKSGLKDLRDKKETKVLPEGMTQILFDKISEEPSSKKFTWPNGSVSVRWFYHHKNFAWIIPDTVHWKVVALKRRFEEDMYGVEITAVGKGKQRRYTDIIPLISKEENGWDL